MPHPGHWTGTLPWFEEEEATLKLLLRTVHMLHGYEGLGGQDAKSSPKVIQHLLGGLRWVRVHTCDGDRASMVELSALEGQACCGPTTVLGSASPCTQNCPRPPPHTTFTQPAVSASVILLLPSLVSWLAHTLGISVGHWLFASLPITIPLGVFLCP